MGNAQGEEGGGENLKQKGHSHAPHEPCNGCVSFSYQQHEAFQDFKAEAYCDQICFPKPAL